MITRTASKLRLLAGTAIVLGVLTSCTGSPSTTDPAPPASSPSGMETMATETPETMAPQTMAPRTTAPQSPSDNTAPAAGALALAVAETNLGAIVVDGEGMTLYMFTKDSANTSACEGQCLVAWPPLLGEPTEGEGVDDSKLGSFTRTDGRVQASYNGWPLYYWQGDSNPGDTTGQDVQGVWYVLDRDGEPIR